MPDVEVGNGVKDIKCKWSGKIPGADVTPNPVYTEHHAAEPIFVKHDKEKLQFRLLPPVGVEEVIKVLMHGAEKYSPDNWRLCRESDRYWDAAQRHLWAHQRGEKLDTETGLPHVAHAAACLLILVELDTHNRSKP